MCCFPILFVLAYVTTERAWSSSIFKIRFRQVTTATKLALGVRKAEAFAAIFTTNTQQRDLVSPAFAVSSLRSD